MDRENNQILKNILEITEENNKIIKKMRKYQRISNVIKVAYWIIVLSIFFGFYYILQPILKPINSLTKTIFGDKVSDDSLENIKKILNIDTEKK